MIITYSTKVRVADPARFAWAGLRKFQNIELVTERLIALHDVPSKWHDDVRKQARQLRYCLIQASEYFSAAERVSIATKPNLLYYGTMSLALAEILFKQSGASSLDKARSQHRHHGLSMTSGSFPRNASLETSAKSIRATPLEVDGKRKGTFELWHQTSREHPLSGTRTRFFAGGGSTKAFETLMGAVDERSKPLSSNGLTLADCLINLPLLAEHVEGHGLSSIFTRGLCLSNSRGSDTPNWSDSVAIIFHPSPLNGQLLSTLKTDANHVDRVNVDEVVGGGLRITLSIDSVNGAIRFPLPAASMISTDEWRMWTNDPALNEFGYFYVAMHLAGNYARYYPDRWLTDVEASTPLALAIEELCEVATWRVPWLTLCELDRTCYVQEA